MNLGQVPTTTGTNGHVAAPKTDPATVRKALKMLIAPGQAFEIRALECTLRGERRTGIWTGVFDSTEKAVAEIQRIQTAVGVYFTLHAVAAPLLARSHNTLRFALKGGTTSDNEIVGRRLFLIDLDSERASGIAASDAEHKAAIAKAVLIRDWLVAQGIVGVLLVDSGNGAHLYFRVELPADDGGLTERFLQMLATMFNDTQDDIRIKVDCTVHNPSRICRIPGTVNCKGSHAVAIGRPHRLAQILEVPERIEVVPRELLEKLAGPAPEVKPPAAPRSSHDGRGGRNWTPEDYFAHYGWEVTGPWDHEGRRMWKFTECPNNPDHRDGDAAYFEDQEGKTGFNCFHNGCAGFGAKELHAKFPPPRRELATTVVKVRSTNDPDFGEEEPGRAPVLVRLSDVQAEDVRWLWPGRIALGKVTLVVGDPGLGKSFLALDTAARVSQGMAWPDDPSSKAPLGSTVLLTAEDGLADTVRPRLDSAGADSCRIVALKAVKARSSDGKEILDQFSLERDLAELEQAVRATDGCNLVIIDPISAYLGDVDSHNNAAVRRLIAPLAELASRCKVAVLCVTHLNKASGTQAIYRAMGSLAFVAAARAVWAVAKDRENPERRFFLPLKNNLGQDVRGLAYSIVDGKVAWESASVDISADAALAWVAEGEGRSEVDHAAAWLEVCLADGPMAAKEVLAGAKENGIAEKTVRRAQALLKIKPQKDGMNGGWVWNLPSEGGQEVAEDGQR